MVDAEVWKGPPGYEGRYEVSSEGRIWRSFWVGQKKPKGPKRKNSPKPPGLLIPRTVNSKPEHGGYRYPAVWLVDQAGKATSWRVGRLILVTFVGPPAPGQVTRHLNDDAFDNRLVNLRWGTQKENAADRISSGAQVRGSKSPFTSLLEEDIPRIVELYESGKLMVEIAEQIGQNRSVISAILRGQTWQHVPRKIFGPGKRGARRRK